MTIRFPGQLADKDRQNLEGVEFKAAIKVVVFTFSVEEVAKARKIVTVPKNHAIIQPLVVSVEEPFNGFFPTVFLGASSNRESVARAAIGATGGAIVITSVQPDFQRKFTVDTKVLLTVGLANVGDGVLPTKGRGFGVLQYVKV